MDEENPFSRVFRATSSAQIIEWRFSIVGGKLSKVTLQHFKSGLTNPWKNELSRTHPSFSSAPHYVRLKCRWISKLSTSRSFVCDLILTIFNSHAESYTNASHFISDPTHWKVCFLFAGNRFLRYLLLQRFSNFTSATSVFLCCVPHSYFFHSLHF